MARGAMCSPGSSTKPNFFRGSEVDSLSRDHRNHQPPRARHRRLIAVRTPAHTPAQLATPGLLENNDSRWLCIREMPLKAATHRLSARRVAIGHQIVRSHSVTFPQFPYFPFCSLLPPPTPSPYQLRHASLGRELTGDLPVQEAGSADAVRGVSAPPASSVAGVLQQQLHGVVVLVPGIGGGR